MNDRQEAELTSGRDTTLHSHQFDRTPTHDTLSALHGLERVKSVTSAYIATRDDDIILVDTTAAGVAVTLPTARGGKRYSIVRTAGANPVTVVAVAGTINGAASISINTNYTPARLKAINGNYIEC